jgi:hypothetical protein
MRYHAGLGVGHVHTHLSSANGIPCESRNINVPDDPIPEQLPGGWEMQAPDVENEQNDETENPEMALEDRENEGWEDVESDDSGDASESNGQSSEDDDE